MGRQGWRQRLGWLRRRSWILGFVGGAVSVMGCEKPDRCGNGVVGAGEVCDDGNLVNGDGCSSTCQLDDNLSTPGDDRANFVLCANPFGGPVVTCGPGLGCCNDPPGTHCELSNQQCQSPFDFQGCDGPEDCGGGAACDVTRNTTDCGASVAFVVRCHVDADCPHAGDVCDRGDCPTFSLPTNL
jgi:cysteine-rich repeat protein